MDLEELKKQLDEKVHATGELLHICDLGRFALVDIESFELMEFMFKEEGKEPRKNNRYVITFKGLDKKVVSPVSVMGMLKELLAKQERVTHVTVLRTGTGLSTKYALMPEIQVK